MTSLELISLEIEEKERRKLPELYSLYGELPSKCLSLDWCFQLLLATQEVESIHNVVDILALLLDQMQLYFVPSRHCFVNIIDFRTTDFTDACNSKKPLELDFIYLLQLIKELHLELMDILLMEEKISTPWSRLNQFQWTHSLPFVKHHTECLL